MNNEIRMKPLKKHEELGAYQSQSPLSELLQSKLPESALVKSESEKSGLQK